MFGIGQRKIVLRPSAAVPGAIGQATVGRDKNGNSTVKSEVWHLARPQDLTPPAETYRGGRTGGSGSRVGAKGHGTPQAGEAVRPPGDPQAGLGPAPVTCRVGARRRPAAGK